MANVAARRRPSFIALFTNETHAELSGIAPMDYIPTMQIRVTPGGAWHRRGPENEHTACGLTYSMCAVRPYIGHVDDLCVDCFTKHEREVRPST